MKECIEYAEPYYGAVAYTAQHSAVVVDEKNKVWKDGREVLDPIVVAKWAGGPVVRGPMSAGTYSMEHGKGVKYYYLKLTK